MSKRFVFSAILLSLFMSSIACQAATVFLPASATPLPPTTTVQASQTATFTQPPSPTLAKPSDTVTPEASPTSSNGWNIYRNTTYGFEIQYPAGGSLTVNLPDEARIDLPHELGTNLQEKYLSIHAQPLAGECLSSLAEGLPPESRQPETLVVGLNEFSVLEGSEGAAGNQYDWKSYAIQNEDSCVTLDFVLHSTNPLNYPTPPTPFDPELESRVFSQIINTFVWFIP
ncbi:MAG: hypothetical protein ACPL4H_10350 [Anaerolineales bacterium]